MNEIGNHLPNPLNLPPQGAPVRAPRAQSPAAEMPPRSTDPAGAKLPTTWEGPAARALESLKVAPSLEETMTAFSSNLAADLNTARGDAFDTFSRLGFLQTAFGQALSRNADLIANPSLRSIA